MVDRDPLPSRPVAVVRSSRAEPSMRAFERLIAFGALAGAAVLALVRST
jgi:hypothetical protein